ncbi:hypothetical protein [Glycomyces harbinensis]|uniref:DUF4352 domain-containing protein n=1 Tax=Glycomyces harbinensis TaxID=58114 RepID=A0A1G6Z4F6_9ACTN|nr:hypothetical protein [Glycomyces harbinensis]SDD96837.1 hypothetical protein SAMN05216270_11018 [Glycomyces harbinensis]
MNIEFPEISKRLLAVSGAALIGLAALTACGGGEADSDGDTGSTEEAADDGAEEAAATGDGTSPESPLPAGSTVEITDWTVGGSVVLDATEEVLAANEYNEAPAEGFQQSLVTLEGTYSGTESSSLWIDTTFGIWADGTFYDSIDCLNMVENDLMDAGEVSGGSSTSGGACVEVPADAETYLLYIEDLWSFEGTQYFIEIA